MEDPSNGERLRRFLTRRLGPSLWVPEPVGWRPRLPDTVAPVRVVIDEKQAGLEPTGVPAMQDFLARLPRDPALLWISKLAATIANMPDPGDQAQQLQLATLFFDDQTFDHLRKGLAARPNVVIFHRLQLLTLMRMLLNDGPKRVEQMDDEQIRQHLGRAALAVNSHMERDVQERIEGAPSNEERQWQMIVFGVRNGLFHGGSASLRQLMGRSGLLWVDLPKDPAFRPSHDLNIDALFEAATGISLENYLAYGLAFALTNQSFSLLSAEPQSFTVISRTQPFPDADAQHFASSQRVVDLLTFGGDPEGPEQILRNLYAFKAFKQRPLAPFEEDARLPIDLGFLQEAVTLGVFWIINDYLRDGVGEAASQRWRQYFGDLLEHYARRLIGSVFDAEATVARRVFGPQDWGSSEGLRHGERAHQPDVAVLYPKAIIFVEVIATRLHFIETAIEGDPERLRRDLEQMVYEPVAQLNGAIDHFRRGIIRLAGVNPETLRIYPIVMVPEGFPQFPMLWDQIMSELEGRGILQSPERDRLQVWELEEFESLLALAEEGNESVRDLPDFVDEKAGNIRSRFMPLGNFLYVKGLRPGLVTLLREARDRLVDRLSRLLEGQMRENQV